MIGKKEYSFLTWIQSKNISVMNSRRLKRVGKKRLKSLDQGSKALPLFVEEMIDSKSLEV